MSSFIALSSSDLLNGLLMILLLRLLLLDCGWSFCLSDLPLGTRQLASWFGEIFAWLRSSVSSQFNLIIFQAGFEPCLMSIDSIISIQFFCRVSLIKESNWCPILTNFSENGSVSNFFVIPGRVLASSVIPDVLSCVPWGWACWMLSEHFGWTGRCFLLLLQNLGADRARS